MQHTEQHTELVIAHEQGEHQEMPHQHCPHCYRNAADRESAVTRAVQDAMQPAPRSTRAQEVWDEVYAVMFTPCSSPPGKLADAEIHFGGGTGPFHGLKLCGFAVWQRRGGGRTVTFPARQYVVSGERRSYALLRPADLRDAHDRQGQIRDLILGAYAAWEREQRKVARATR